MYEPQYVYYHSIHDSFLEYVLWLFPFGSEETEPLERVSGLPQNTHLTFIEVPAVNHRVSEPPEEGRARAGMRASHFRPALVQRLR